MPTSGLRARFDGTGLRLDLPVCTPPLRTYHRPPSHLRSCTPGGHSFRQTWRLWGVNTVTMESETNGRTRCMMHALTAISANDTRGFVVLATPRKHAGEAEAGADAQATARAFVLRLINEDAPIFRTIHLRRDCLTASDRFLAFGIDYICRYPTAHPGRDFIRSAQGSAAHRNQAPQAVIARIPGSAAMHRTVHSPSSARRRWLPAPLRDC